MQFFDDTNGNSRPVSAIVKIGKAREITYRDTKRKANVRSVDLVDEQQCEISDFDHRHIMEMPVHMVPAAPGTFILQAFEEEAGGDGVPWQTPVIAWAYTASGDLVPYTVDGANDGLDIAGPILHPSGMVTEAGGSSWRTLENYMTGLQAERDAKKQTDEGAS